MLLSEPRLLEEEVKMKIWGLLVVDVVMRGDREFVCVNACEKLGSMGARVYPVLSLVFTTLVNQTRQIYMMQIEMSQVQLSEYIFGQPGRKSEF